MRSFYFSGFQVLCEELAGPFPVCSNNFLWNPNVEVVCTLLNTFT